MENELTNLILSIDPLVRQYHRNVIRFYTGFNALEAKSLDLEDSKLFLKSLWARCLEWSNQRPSRILKSLHELDSFLNTFKNETEIHDMELFLGYLNSYRSKTNSVIERGYKSNNSVEAIIELLTMFYSVRVKTASLITRFLTLDSNFFGDCSSIVNPPLDRVNFRMLQLLKIQNELAEKASYGPVEQKMFSQIGTDLLGKSRKGLIDNLWFIGHFYCDDNSDCKFREVFRFLEPVILNDIKFSESCPFTPLACSQQKRDQ
jgi:hypothetical protein